MVAVQISKVVVVTINVIFLIFGVAALAAGIVFKVGWDKVKDAFDIKEVPGLKNEDELELKTAGEAVALGAIIFGSFIIVLSFFGCVGACCRVKALLVIYAIVVLLLLLAQVAVVIVVGIKAQETENKISGGLFKILQNNNYTETSGDGKSKPWSALFNYLECCGVNNYTDFKKDSQGIPYFYAQVRPTNLTGVNYTVPITCCRGFDYEKDLVATDFTSDKIAGCLNHSITTAYYNRGCVDAVVDEVKDHKWIFIGVGIAIFVIELLVILLACYLCCSGSDKDGVV